MPRGWLLASLAVFAMIAAAVVTVPQASADVFIVTNLSGVGPGSLRDAIDQANANGTGQDTINFAVTGTINSPLPDINTDLVIAGPGAAQLAIQPGSARAFAVAGGRTVAMSGMTIQGAIFGNIGGGAGAGIANAGNLTLTDMVIRNNHVQCALAGSHCDGGGIYNNGTLSLTNVAVKENSILGVGQGRGAGIYSLGTLRLRNVTISQNVNDSGSDVSPPLGGGLFLDDTAFVEGEAFLDNVTISLNAAAGPGIAAGLGGGIYVNGAIARLRNVTVAENLSEASAAIYQDSGLLSIANTIVADNFAPLAPDCFPGLFSLGFNLIGNPTGCTLETLTGTDLTGVNPMLGSLANNGGPTQTKALLAGSLAIDGGNPAGCMDSAGVLLTTDQRGLPRPTDGDTNGSFICDIGAYEAPGPAAPPPPPTPTATAIVPATATATSTPLGGGGKVVPTLAPQPPTSTPLPTSTPFNPKVGF